MVVVSHWPQVVLVGCDVDVVVEVEVEVDVVLDDVVVACAVVVVPAGPVGPQNCTLEMSGGWWLCPASGRPSFEKEPVTCGGAIE